MRMARCSNDATTLRKLRNRIPAALLLACALLISSGLGGQAWAQTERARVGILAFSTTADDPRLEVSLDAFRSTLADRGWIEGKNVTFEYQSANSDPSQFAVAAAALVELKVDVILATSAPALRAAYGATRTIPIVAVDYTTDPIAEGYVESYGRPGGNVTGIFLDAPDFAGKWFELLNAVIPNLSSVAVVWDPGPGTTHLQAVRNVAGLLDINLQVLEVRTPEDIDQAFNALREVPQGVIFLPSPMIHGQTPRLARLALIHRLPATSMALKFADAGGMLAYGPHLNSTWERNAVLVAKILDGSDPAELPVERPTKIQLIVNMRTARTLGITIPQSILLRADEVIR